MDMLCCAVCRPECVPGMRAMHASYLLCCWSLHAIACYPLPHAIPPSPAPQLPAAPHAIAAPIIVPHPVHILGGGSSAGECVLAGAKGIEALLDFRWVCTGGWSCRCCAAGLEGSA